jgi:ubiquinone/menaquinone biosynthesis C-methylase UbiE
MAGETTMSEAGRTMDEIKASMRRTWMAGDFGVVAKTNRGAAERFVGEMRIEPGMRALDVACGTGNVAIPMARAGAEVRGIDLAPNLLDQARTLAAAEGLAIGFDEGDAEQMPYGDGSFDVVATMFGAMFAPRPEVVAAELGRVVRPGGLLAMANWNPASFTARMFHVGSQHAAPPRGVAPPVLWGDEATVRERLEPYFEQIRTELVPVLFDLPTNAAGAVSFFRRFFGPTQVAFSRLDEVGQARFAAELEALWAGANEAENPEEQVLVRSEYLQVMGRRRPVR